jgi:hypothetical protein
VTMADIECDLADLQSLGFRAGPGRNRSDNE